MATDSERLNRLRAARASGHVPPELFPWLIGLAAAAAGEMQTVPMSPSDRLALAISTEVDRWMTKRGVNGRTIGFPRRSLVRVLKGQNVNLATVADVADALGCDAVITFQPRADIAPVVAPIAPQLAPLHRKRPG